MDNVILEIGLALVLIAFAVALAHKLGLSNVPFLILIGMAVGPHAPQIGVFDFRFIETQSLIAFMGRMGVLFLLFYLGLESNVTRLIKAADPFWPAVRFTSESISPRASRMVTSRAFRCGRHSSLPVSLLFPRARSSPRSFSTIGARRIVKLN